MTMKCLLIAFRVRVTLYKVVSASSCRSQSFYAKRMVTSCWISLAHLTVDIESPEHHEYLV